MAVLGDAKFTGNFNNPKVGNESFIGKVNLALRGKIIIGNNVVINEGFTFLTASHGINCPDRRHVKIPVVIADYAWM